MKIVDMLVLALGMIAFVSLMGDEPAAKLAQDHGTSVDASAALNFLSRPYDAATAEAVR